MNENFQISPFQQRVHTIPEVFDVFLGGGRGGAKSWALALLAMRHVEQYQSKARILYIRQSYPGIADFENITRELFTVAYGRTAKYNSSSHVWRLPHGAYMELGQLENASDYPKYQGRSFTLLLVDEAGQYATPELLDRLRSNLRGPKKMPVRMVIAANPGDVGHHWIAQRYVFKAKSWQPFHEEKSQRTWVHAPSTFLDNPFIDQDSYKAQLESSCPTDPELLRAWLEGDWAVARGAFFAQVIDEKRNAVDPWAQLPGEIISLAHVLPAKQAILQHHHWDFFLAHDFGTSAPSVTYLCARSPGAEGPDGFWYPRDSIILVDELATAVPGQLNQGLGYTVPHLSEEIVAFTHSWGLKRAEGVADDACFSNHGHGAGSIADEFHRCNVYFRPAKKGNRIYGWEVMRRMLQDAGKPDVPGLYISRNCEYFWATVPYLARDPRNAQDLDSRGPDHGADACRYGLLHQGIDTKQIKLGGI
ncbi:MAG: phage terminase large subunit [Candidatus Sedimenticola sp. (ex Thyasira tokunagai)]